MSRVGAIVLAAGQSRRMGRQKLLLPLAGQTLIGHIVDQLLAVPLDAVCVVIRAGDRRVPAALAGRAMQFVVNPERDGDMLSSVRAGLRALPRDYEAVLVVLGDQPSLTAGLVRRMIRASSGSDRGIVLPVHDGRRGHPLLFSMRYRDEVLSRFDELGLRGLLTAHAEDIVEVAADRSVLEDIDVPADYRRQVGQRRRRRSGERGD